MIPCYPAWSRRLSHLALWGILSDRCEGAVSCARAKHIRHSGLSSDSQLWYNPGHGTPTVCAVHS